jgi:hypothetical protein
MAQHMVRKEASVLLCEAVQGAFLIRYAFFTYFEMYAHVTYFAHSDSYFA